MALRTHHPRSHTGVVAAADPGSSTSHFDGLRVTVGAGMVATTAVRPLPRLDTDQHNVYVVSVLPPFTPKGLLPPGLHRATWDELCSTFGSTRRRRRLLEGLLRVATNLRDAGAVNLWLDGSFVTSKPNPDDFDGVWDPSRVNLRKVDPVLTDLSDLRNGRLRQKAKYHGELMISAMEQRSGLPFEQFFQQTSEGDVKGIVLLDLRTLP